MQKTNLGYDHGLLITLKHAFKAVHDKDDTASIKKLISESYDLFKHEAAKTHRHILYLEKEGTIKIAGDFAWLKFQWVSPYY